MKTLLLALFLLSAQISFAKNLTAEDLIGKYVGVGGDCLDERVYIKKTTAAGGQYLDVTYYGTEASIDQIRLGQGAKELGHTNLTWATKYNEDTIIFTETTASLVNGTVSVTRWSFAILEDGNVYHEKLESTVSSTTREFKTTCELERQ